MSNIDNDVMIKTIQILKYTQEEIVANLEYTKLDRLNNLDTVLDFIYEVAEKHKDIELQSLIDDMQYPVHEALMGALGKGFDLLPEIQKKLDEIENRKEQEGER